MFVDESGIYRPQVTGRAGVAARHGGIEAAFINEHQPLRRVQVRGQVVEERRTAFLRAFSGDQRFFYA